MSIASIVLFALTASATPPATHEVWEADIMLPAEPSPVYVLQRDDHLNAMADHFGVDWMDIIDVQGRTMPRGYELLLKAPGGANHFIWFDAVGTPPYHVRVGAKSARRPEYISNEDQNRLLGAHPDGVQLPLAQVRNVRKTGTFTEQAPRLTAEEVQAGDDNRLAAIIAILAALAVASMAVIDYVLRRKIAALRGDNS